MTNQEFCVKVLRLAIQYDAYESLFWTFQDESPFIRRDGQRQIEAPLSVAVNCNDTFYWATADCEDVTPENIDVFEQALKDSAHLGGERFYGPVLFACRVRHMRPQPPYCKGLSKELVGLFDACGPARNQKECG